MEKRLLLGAFLLLIVEVLWLLADMNVIYIRGVTQLSSQSGQQEVGYVEQRQQNLKRRNLNSIVWEETYVKDPLYLFDSVLTLDHSSAVLNLNGDTQLSLSENTLVFLEPSSNQDVNQLRIKFSRGDMKSRNPNRDIEVNASNWFIEIEKGSQVNVRTKDSENLEVEVLKGKVGIKEQSQKDIKQFESGDVIWMNKNEISKQNLITEVNWITPIENLFQIRHYSHQFPVSIQLTWSGEAQKIIWEDQTGKKKKFNLEPTQNNMVIQLDRGLHHFRLRSPKGVTEALPVEVWKAPEIHLFSPLPRNRYVVNTPVNFSWSQIENVVDYNLLVFDQNQIPIFSKHYSNQNVVQETISAEGAYEWSVEALDVLGFKIPHLYRVPIYFIHEPLEAPQLEAPVLKKPPEDSPQSSLKKFYKLHFLNILKNLFIETAYASSDKYEAIFSWKPVSGALRYVIEIDDEPNFRSPLVIKKVNKTSFNWKNFKLGQYYWRVAAEGKNEQMGLFSSVSKADLSDPKLFLNTHSGNLKVKKIEEATEIKFEEPISPQAVQEDTKPIEVKVSEPVKMVEKEVSKPIHGYFLWEPTYELSEYRNEDPTRASFTGIYFISFDARIDVPVGATEDVSLRLKYKDSSFKPNPDNEYPFQENLNRNKISFSSYYGASFKPRLGIKAETLQGIKRKSFEEIEFNSYIGFGPSLLWPLSENKHYSTLESSLLLLSQGWNFGLELKLLKDFELSSRLKGLYGIGFEASYFQLTDQRGYQIYPYLSIGLHW